MPEFDVPLNTAVVTTSYVTSRRHPVLYVSHVQDEDGAIMWQFHADNGDYSPSVLQLVGLGQVLALDPGLAALGDLPIGYCARRKSITSPWVIEPDPD